jgi:hypothetical protein
MAPCAHVPHLTSAPARAVIGARARCELNRPGDWSVLRRPLRVVLPQPECGSEVRGRPGTGNSAICPPTSGFRSTAGALAAAVRSGQPAAQGPRRRGLGSRGSCHARPGSTRCPRPGDQGRVGSGPPGLSLIEPAKGHSESLQKFIIWQVPVRGLHGGGGLPRRRSSPWTGLGADAGAGSSYPELRVGPHRVPDSSSGGLDATTTAARADTLRSEAAARGHWQVHARRRLRAFRGVGCALGGFVC